MNPDDIQQTYFTPGTKGHKLLSFFYTRYRDLFIKTIHQEFDEFMNQIYLNVSGIKFSEEIKNIEAYIIGSLKIQCRVQLDLAMKMKARSHIEDGKGDNQERDKRSILDNLPTREPDPHDTLESSEIFTIVNIFKLSLNDSERDLLNSLIDELPRKHIAGRRNQNINTLDTQIRRLRIKLHSFLKEHEYTFPILSKYDISS